MKRIADGALWAQVRARTADALASGALEPIATDVTAVVDDGARFELRLVSSLARKPGPPTGGKDPFALPWEAALHVGDVSATHGCLLNKYPVFPHHVLLVTRAFEPQEAWLTAADAEALWGCLEQTEAAVGFYNGGTGAGASQPHKHLQVVPARAPLEPFLLRGALPVRHALEAPPRDPHAFARRCTHLLEQLGVTAGGAWNLVMTRDWLLVVPRRAERFEDVSINALGFAGSLLVKTDAQRARLEAAGPLAALRAVGVPR